MRPNGDEQREREWTGWNRRAEAETNAEAVAEVNILGDAASLSVCRMQADAELLVICRPVSRSKREAQIY